MDVCPSSWRSGWCCAFYLFSTTDGGEFSFDFLSLGLPTRSIDSPFFFELFAIPSTEFAVQVLKSPGSCRSSDPGLALRSAFLFDMLLSGLFEGLLFFSINPVQGG